MPAKIILHCNIKMLVVFNFFFYISAFSILFSAAQKTPTNQITKQPNKNLKAKTNNKKKALTKSPTAFNTF